MHVSRRRAAVLVARHARQQLERAGDIAVDRLAGRREVDPLDLLERIEHGQQLAHDATLADPTDVSARVRSSATGRVFRTSAGVTHARRATRDATTRASRTR